MIEIRSQRQVIPLLKLMEKEKKMAAHVAKGQPDWQTGLQVGLESAVILYGVKNMVNHPDLGKTVQNAPIAPISGQTLHRIEPVHHFHAPHIKLHTRPESSDTPALPIILNPESPALDKPHVKISTQTHYHSTPEKKEPKADSTPDNPYHLYPTTPKGDLMRKADGPNTDFELLHKPSTSVAAIQQELESADSPLATMSFTIKLNGKTQIKTAAQYIYDAGVVDGIDPAFFMGMFKEESSYGKYGAAAETFCPGNIIALGDEPAVGRFRKYDSWAEGIDATFGLLREYAKNWGYTDVYTAVSIWAPPTDHNDVEQYEDTITSTMNYLYQQSLLLEQQAIAAKKKHPAKTASFSSADSTVSSILTFNNGMYTRHIETLMAA